MNILVFHKHTSRRVNVSIILRPRLPTLPLHLPRPALRIEGVSSTPSPSSRDAGRNRYVLAGEAAPVLLALDVDYPDERMIS